MSTGPGVSEQARALVGTVTRRYVSEPVSLRQVREYIAGTGGNPQSFTGFDGLGRPVPVPPLFFHAACRPIVAENDLLDDGQYPFLGVEGVTGESLAGGNTYEALAPVYVGDVLTSTEVLGSIDERVGRSGRLAITTTVTTYTNQHGSDVGRYRQVIVFK